MYFLFLKIIENLFILQKNTFWTKKQSIKILTESRFFDKKSRTFHYFSKIWTTKRLIKSNQSASGAHVLGARAIKNWDLNNTRGPLGARSKSAQFSLFLVKITKILHVLNSFFLRKLKDIVKMKAWPKIKKSWAGNFLLILGQSFKGRKSARKRGHFQE